MAYRFTSNLLLLFLSGCSTLSYLWQAGEGQLALMNHARPIPEVLKDETTPPRIRTLLAEVSAIKAFGEKMGLKPTRNYEDYVKLDRDAAVYVVSACHPLKFEPKEWKFPIVGGFPYLGWYHPEDAKKYAESLRAENLDVDVRGAPAYSTLGWFRDPILSSMIPAGDGAAPELVEVVLHESLHATAYVNHQAFFNESAASWVSEKLTPIYLRSTRGENSPEEKVYGESLEWQEKYMQKMHAGYLALEHIYTSTDSDSIKFQKKFEVITELKKTLKWKEGRDLNNATLVGYREYSGNRAVFDQMFLKCGSDWHRFFGGLKNFGEKDFEKPQSKDIAALVGRINCG